MQVLQSVHFAIVQVPDGPASRNGRGERRVIRHVAAHGLGPDGLGLGYRLLTFGGIDDQINLLVVDVAQNLFVVRAGRDRRD